MGNYGKNMSGIISFCELNQWAKNALKIIYEKKDWISRIEVLSKAGLDVNNGCMPCVAQWRAFLSRTDEENGCCIIEKKKVNSREHPHGLVYVRIIPGKHDDVKRALDKMDNTTDYKVIQAGVIE